MFLQIIWRDGFYHSKQTLILFKNISSVLMSSFKAYVAQLECIYWLAQSHNRILSSILRIRNRSVRFSPRLNFLGELPTFRPWWKSFPRTALKLFQSDNDHIFFIIISRELEYQVKKSLCITFAAVFCHLCELSWALKITFESDCEPFAIYF